MARAALIDPRTSRVTDLRSGRYADGTPLHDVQDLECKLMLKIDECRSRRASGRTASS